MVATVSPATEADMSGELHGGRFNSREEIDKVRNSDLGAIALYFPWKELSEETELLITKALKEVVLLHPAAVPVILTLLEGLREFGAVVELRDNAAWSAQTFLQIGPDRQALWLPVLEGLRGDYEHHFLDKGEDPLRGFNKILTERSPALNPSEPVWPPAA